MCLAEKKNHITRYANIYKYFNYPCYLENNSNAEILLKSLLPEKYDVNVIRMLSRMNSQANILRNVLRICCKNDHPISNPFSLFYH